MEPATVILTGLTLAVVALGVASARINLPFTSDRLVASDRGPAEDDPAQREREVREHVLARNERLLARGKLPLAVEEEVARLLALAEPEHEELRAEVRVLVERKNERRVAAGEEPLDVESEIDRRLRELGAHPAPR